MKTSYITIALMLSVVLLQSCSYRLSHFTYNSMTHWSKEDRDSVREEERMDRKSFRYSDKDKRHYQKFAGNITSIAMGNEQCVQFDSIRLFFSNASESYKNIFYLGLLYPQLIYCTFDSSCDRQKIYMYWKSHPLFYLEEGIGMQPHTVANVNGAYQNKIWIKDFAEIHHQHNKPSQRKFAFIVHMPETYFDFKFYMELTNDHANKKTDLDTFIKGARVTYFRYTSAAI